MKHMKIMKGRKKGGRLKEWINLILDSGSSPE
jgi:hypothetical protein